MSKCSECAAYFALLQSRIQKIWLPCIRRKCSLPRRGFRTMLLAFGLCFLELDHRWLTTWQKVFETSMAQVDDLTEIVNQNAKNAEEATRTRVYRKKQLWLFCFGRHSKQMPWGSWEDSPRNQGLSSILDKPWIITWSAFPFFSTLSSSGFNTAVKTTWWLLFTHKVSLPRIIVTEAWVQWGMRPVSGQTWAMGCGECGSVGYSEI